MWFSHDIFDMFPSYLSILLLPIKPLLLHLFPATLDNLLYEDAVDTNDDSAVVSKRFVPLAYIKELNP